MWFMVLPQSAVLCQENNTSQAIHSSYAARGICGLPKQIPSTVVVTYCDGDYVGKDGAVSHGRGGRAGQVVEASGSLGSTVWDPQ